MINTSTIFNIATSENHVLGERLGLSFTTADNLAGHCLASCFTQDDLVHESIDYAKNFTKHIEQAIENAEVNMECCNDDEIERIDQFQKDISILQGMLNWTYDKSHIIQLANEYWKEMELQRA